ncbi:MAG: lipoyl(octanoyl) transferase LipB [Vulcanimicrobiota bacterium]
MRRLGTVDYAKSQALQQRLVARRKADEIADQLLLCQHPPVITLGRATDRQYLRVSEAQLAADGIDLVHSGRGGAITYHGPGQLVAYPILKLEESRRDLHGYLRDLEEVAILTAAHFGLEAERVPGRTGAWVNGAKLAAIGVRASAWVTSHGLSLNVTHLKGFDLIVPCGIADAEVTSLERLLGRPAPLLEVENALCQAFAEVFQRNLQEVSEPLFG